MIPYGRQLVEEDDIDAVVRVLRGDWLTTGPAIEAFERTLTDYTGARHAVCFASGTAALHGAIVAGGLGEGDTVATSPLSFVASANCARYAGATVTFGDIDPDTLNLDVAALPRGLDGLVAVHYAGLPIDLSGLTERPRVVIEDAAHALGAHTPDGPVGACRHSDMCAFSFHPVKVITSGEGGAVTTNSDELADRLRRFRNHGMTRRPDLGGWAYEVTDLGMNYRLTDFQAALGASQMAKLDRFVERRNTLAERYRDALAGLPARLPPAAPPGWRHAYHLFPLRLDDRRRVYEELAARGVGSQVHYPPIHLHPLYRDLGFGPGSFPAAEEAYEQVLAIPLFPAMTDEEQSQVIAALREILGASTT